MDINMEELVKTVSEKADITVEQAKKAVTAVIEQLKVKLPDFGAQFEGFLKEPLAGIKR